MTLRHFLLPLLIVLAWGVRKDALPWLWRKPTDWSAKRRALGYEDVPERELPKEVRGIRYRYFLGWWPLKIDWDAERKRLGYHQ